MEILLYTFISSIIVFIIFGFDKRRQTYSGTKLPSAAMIILSALAPFGALFGMVLFNNRLRQTLFLISIPLLLILYAFAVYAIAH